jgi:hypothetical protein
MTDRRGEDWDPLTGFNFYLISNMAILGAILLIKILSVLYRFAI